MRVSFSQNQKNDPEVRSGVKIPYSPGKRKTSKLLWWSILAIVFTPLIVLLLNIFIDWIFVSSPGIISMDSFAITAPENGYVKEVYAKKGSDVDNGFVAMKLVREPSPELIDQIALMKAERDSLSSALSSPAKFPLISTRLVDQNIEFYRKEAVTVRRLMEQGAATRAELNLAESNLRSAMAERESILSVRADDTAEKNTRSRLDYYNRSIEYLESLKGSSFEVLIKRAGRIQSIEAFPGQSVNAGDDLLWIADPRTAKVIVYVAPENFEKIKIDSEVKVVLPGKSKGIKAVVEEMPTTSQSTPGGLGSRMLVSPRSIRVYLTLKQPLPEERIVDGLPVKVEWGLRSFF